VQGGTTPVRLMPPSASSPSGTSVPANMAAPAAAPTVALSNDVKYYVARVDVRKPGAVYYSPPTVTFRTSNNTRTRSAVAAAYLEQSSVSEIRLADGGKGYTEPPEVVLGDSHGKGVKLTAILDGEPPQLDGIQELNVTNGPPFEDELGLDPAYKSRWNVWGAVDIPITNGSGSITKNILVYHGAGGDECATLACNNVSVPISLSWTVTGVPQAYSRTGTTTIGSNVVTGLSSTASLAVDMPVAGSGIPAGTIVTAIGTGQVTLSANATAASSTSLTFGSNASGAVATIAFAGSGIESAECTKVDGAITNCFAWYRYCWAVNGARVKSRGTGYTDGSTPTITIRPSASPNFDAGGYLTPGPAEKAVVVECYTPAHPRNSTAPRFSVKRVDVSRQDPNVPQSGYIVEPQVKFSSTSGFGAYATADIDSGAISLVPVENGGGGYKKPPDVVAVSGGAEAFAVSRPHLRGKYQCYYRYVDDTPEDTGGPIPSNLSPVTEVDAGEGKASVSWTVASGSNNRTRRVELWRSTSNQAITLYRVTTLAVGTTTFTDDLTDEELRDPDRAGNAAMPIFLASGELNAMRFTPTPAKKGVVVRFQDRFWYAADTSGTEPNTIYFSEIDEPESVPEENSLVVQQNARDGDAITALIPYGPMLLVMQQRHFYTLTFARQPLLDAQVTPAGYRGCLNQRTWDIYDGMCCVMDRSGIYVVDQSGGVKSISDQIGDLFRSRIDFSDSTWFFLSADIKGGVLRAFVSFAGEGAVPTTALCYSFETTTWWMEKYPAPVRCATQAVFAGGSYGCLYGWAGATAGGLLALDEGPYDYGFGAIVSVTLTNAGAGYKTPPTVTVSGGGGAGARLRATLGSGGKLAAVWIVNPGHSYSSPVTVTISAPNDPDAGAPVQATASAVLADGPMFVPYLYKSGCAEYPSDSADPKAAADHSRNVAITYAPQASSCPIALRMFYNNASSPRRNITTRNRGVGFTGSETASASILDMGANLPLYGSDSGVAQALYSGKSPADMDGADRNVASELTGVRRNADPVVIYRIDTGGVGGK
jgi:hypothetical protein